MTDPAKLFGEFGEEPPEVVGRDYDAEAERTKRETLAGVKLPVMVVTDLGSLTVIVREDEVWGFGAVPHEVWPYPIQIETFGDGGRRLAAIPLKLEHVEQIHAALGRFLAGLIPGDPLHRRND
jgi:hypothetical protein